MIMTYKECIEKFGNAYQVNKVMEAGFVYKIEEGIYSDNEFESEAAVILKKYPKTVLTGDYAFYVHGLTNVVPDQYSLATEQKAAVISDNVGTLKKLPGIGAKSAQRIILELKDKLKTIDVEDDSSEELKAVINQNQNIEELISALQVLGYTKKEVEKIIPKLDNKDDNLENLIKKALLLLSK